MYFISKNRITYKNNSYIFDYKLIIEVNESVGKKNINLLLDNILNDIPSVEVYLMPLGDTADIIDKNSLSVIEMAINNGFKYSDRLHIRVWNNKRGV